uniref:E3 ubiquitin-protein ligase TRIM39-like n=1 Tax=Neogobius melanostomus TaxID=47308 RepID=A0A8C6S9K3_9GOBI
MATATCNLSEHQFCCCICLDVFTDPTALPCGHNFCKGCIERNWANTVVFKCPYCNQVFQTKPELKVNIFIAEMSAQFRESIKRKDRSKLEQQVAKPGEIACDVCTETKLKALKSCLVCLASYCSTHLKDHKKRHQLVEPLGNLEENVCPAHSKVLELYCKNDDMCICALCAYTHKSHEVVPLREVSEQKRQQLTRMQTEIEDMIKTRQMKVQELRHSEESTNSDKEMTEGLRVLTALKETVERALENLFQEIVERQAAAKSQSEAMIQELEREISDLNKRLTEVQRLSRSNNHLQIVQNSKLKRSTSRMKDWRNVTVSTPRFEGIVAMALSKLEEEFSKITKGTLEGELKRVKKFETLVTLDGATAHPQLVVSQNGAQVNYSIEQRNVRNTLKRFDDYFVLGKQGFAQKFYFEAEMKGKLEWTLGVAKEMVNRKGSLKLDPQNGAWTIGLKDKNYFACAEQEVPLSLKSKPEKVGVFVDYEEGRVSFYDVENAALIYSFSGFSFREKLHLICSPGHYYCGNFSPVVICQNIATTRRTTWPTWAAR